MQPEQTRSFGVLIQDSDFLEKLRHPLSVYVDAIAQGRDGKPVGRRCLLRYCTVKLRQVWPSEQSHSARDEGADAIQLRFLRSPDKAGS